MKGLKRTVVVLLVVCFLLSMAACSPSNESNQAAGNDSQAASDGNASQEGGAAASSAKLTFLDVMPSPERTELLKSLFSRFEKENPGITVEYTSVPFDEANKKLVAMNSSKTLPDVVTMDTNQMTMLATAGGLEPLTKYWDTFKYKDDVSNAFKTALPYSMMYNDELYVIPDGFLLRAIFARTDWIEEQGGSIDDLQDWTWDEYFDMIAKLTDEEKARYGIAFRGGANGLTSFMEYVMSELEQETFYFMDGSNKSVLSDPKAVEYFHNFFDVYLKGYAPKESINWGYKEMVEGFVNGQCGTVAQTPEVVSVCESSMEDGTWTVLPYPRTATAKKDYITWGSSSCYGISANSKNKDASWKLLEFLSSPEVNLEYCKTFGCVPLYTSTMQDPFFTEGAMKGFSDRLLSENIAHVYWPNFITQLPFFLGEYAKGEVQKYLLGEQTAEDTVANLDNWLNTEYEKYLSGK